MNLIVILAKWHSAEQSTIIQKYHRLACIDAGNSEHEA